MHWLANIVALAIIAVACGEDTWPDVAEFCEDQLDLLRLNLDLPNGTPSHDTFVRVFRNMHLDAFETVFQAYAIDLPKAGKANGVMSAVRRWAWTARRSAGRLILSTSPVRSTWSVPGAALKT